MAKKIRASLVTEPLTGPLNVACVIHGNAYDWIYVDRLCNMVRRNLSLPIKFHVYTEKHRDVPNSMVKHVLPDFGLSGPKQSWWYKLEIFNTQHHSGPLLYLDLDLIITGSLDWITVLPLNYFWAIRDFRYLWRPGSRGLNSSIMWFDTRLYSYVYQTFLDNNLKELMKQYKGDQDFITDTVSYNEQKCFDTSKIKSWRWQVLDGGFDFAKRKHYLPGTGAQLDNLTSVVVFHGQPKPHNVSDSTMQKLWI